MNSLPCHSRGKGAGLQESHDLSGIRFGTLPHPSVQTHAASISAFSACICVQCRCPRGVCGGRGWSGGATRTSPISQSAAHTVLSGPRPQHAVQPQLLPADQRWDSSRKLTAVGRAQQRMKGGGGWGSCSQYSSPDGRYLHHQCSSLSGAPLGSVSALPTHPHPITLSQENTEPIYMVSEQPDGGEVS